MVTSIKLIIVRVIGSGFILNVELTRFADPLIKHSCLEAGCNNWAGSGLSPFGKGGVQFYAGRGFHMALLEKKNVLIWGS